MTLDGSFGQLVKCPECGRKKGAKIFYGLPSPEYYDEILQKAHEGKIAMGGCCVSGDDPAYRCTVCEHEWGKADTD